MLQGPNADRFWLPNRSIWLAPITTWRRPQASVSNTRPNGIQPSMAAGAPIAGVSAISRASPSVSTMSGAKLSRASRARWTRWWSSGHHDLAGVAEQFGTGDGADIGAAAEIISHLLVRCSGELADGGLVVGLGAGQVGLHELGPPILGPAASA
jgi:hypothetical protein